jgi:hypothetical protein
MKFQQIEVFTPDGNHDTNLIVAQNKVLDIPNRYPWAVRVAIWEFGRGVSTIQTLAGYNWKWK